MKILVACEESQAVTIELRKMGHNAFSCDILPCSGGYPQWHLQQDLAEILHQDWDMIIAFPPCTHLAVSGAKHFAKKIADGRQQQGIDFFMMIANSKCPRIAIENPVGIMSSKWRKPDQIIQPYYFGDPFQKTTCLWLKGLPPLAHTDIVDKGEFYISPSGKKLPKWYSDNKSAKTRSKTFPGIASAMAQQWGSIMKPEISEEIINGWRREFENNFYQWNDEKDENGKYVSSSRSIAWSVYLAARKKAHSENEDAFKAFTLDLADRYEKEIELLKAELKAEREAVDFYANRENWFQSELIETRTVNDQGAITTRDYEYVDNFTSAAGKLARSTVKNRRIVL